MDPKYVGKVNNEDFNDAINWLAQTGTFMVVKGFPEYPILSDAALYVGTESGHKQIAYAYLVDALKKLIGNNSKDSEGYPLVSLDVGPNTTYLVSVDFISRKDGFRLVNRSKTK